MYTWKLNMYLLKGNLVREEIKKEMKDFQNLLKMKTQHMGHKESSAKRKTNSSEDFPKETGGSIHQQFNSTPESSQTKINKHTKEEQADGNNKTQR